MKLTLSIAFVCLVMCTGCIVPYERMSFYPGYDSIAKNEAEGFYALMLHQTGTDTTFRATVGEDQIPSPMAGDRKILQFAIPTGQIGRVTKWNLSDLRACCVGNGYYVFGPGMIQQGTVTVENYSGETIVLNIESPELDERFQGEHKFKRSLPYERHHPVRVSGSVKK